MPQNDGEVVFQVRADNETLERDLRRSNEIAGNAGNNLAEIAGKAAKFIGGAFAALAVGNFVKDVITSADSLDKAMNGFSSSTGVAIEQTEGYEKVLKNVYANNYGESFEDIANTMGLVNQRMGEMSDEELQKVTERAYLLADTFDMDISESLNGVNQMMKNFGISSEEAYNLIAQGAQAGLNQNGDLADQLSEYAVYYSDLGYTAEEMMNAMANGVKSGAYQIDYLNDAMKEFGIRSKDGSKASTEAFAALGFNADEMTKRFAAGGETSKQAFSEVVNALKNVESDVDRNGIGVSLFGTKFEDLGEDAVKALTDVTGAISTQNDALGQMETTKYNDLASMTEGLRRNIELLVLPIGNLLIPGMKDTINAILPLVNTYGPKVMEVFTKIMQVVIDFKNNAIDRLIGVFDKLKGPFGELIKNLVPQLMDIWGKLSEKVTDLVDNVINKLVEYFLLLAEILKPIIEDILPIFLNILEAVYDVLFEVVSTVLISLIDAFMTIATALMPLITTIIPKLLELFLSLIVPLAELVGAILPVLAEVFAAVATVIAGIIEAVLPVLIDLLDMLIPVIKMIADAVLPAITEAFNVLKEPITELIESLLPLFQAWMEQYLKPAIEKLIPIIKFLAEVLAIVLKNAIEAVTPVIETIIKVLKNVADFITNVFTKNWSGAWDNVKNVVLDVFKFIVGAIERGINASIDLINKLIEGFNSLSSSVGIPEIPTISNVTLPKFHSGGVINFKGKYEAPILAKDGEMVITEQQQKKLFDMANGMPVGQERIFSQATNQAIGTNTNGDKIQLVFNVDGKTLAEITTPYSDLINGANIELNTRGVSY